MINVKEKLLENLLHRQNEVQEYQLDIDNYEIAIERIPKDFPKGHILHSKMQDFKKSLDDLLFSSKVEQAKAITMLKVIEQRLEKEFLVVKETYRDAC
jgi:hypothetical protein